MSPSRQLLFSFPSDRNDRFASFRVDDRNRETALLCRRFVEEISSPPASLLIHGPEGAGKTHLLGAMGRHAEERGEGPLLYLPADTLLADVAGAEAYAELKERLARYETAVFLAVDDIERLEGNERAEEQLFHLFNGVTQGGGRFAAATSVAPARWRFADFLQTRLLWGRALDLKPAGDDTWVAVLTERAADRGLKLPEPVARWMVTRVDRSPSALLAALATVDRRSLTTGRKVSIQLVKDALEDPDDA